MGCSQKSKATDVTVIRITFLSLFRSLNCVDRSSTFSPSYFSHFHCPSKTSSSAEVYFRSLWEILVSRASSVFPLFSPLCGETLTRFISPRQVRVALCVSHTLLFHSMFLVGRSWFTANCFLFFFHLFRFIERHPGAGKR